MASVPGESELGAAGTKGFQIKRWRDQSLSRQRSLRLKCWGSGPDKMVGGSSKGIRDRKARCGGCISVIPALGKLRQENHRFEADWVYWRDPPSQTVISNSKPNTQCLKKTSCCSCLVSPCNPPLLRTLTGHGCPHSPGSEARTPRPVGTRDDALSWLWKKVHPVFSCLSDAAWPWR